MESPRSPPPSSASRSPQRTKKAPFSALLTPPTWGDLRSYDMETCLNVVNSVATNITSQRPTQLLLAQLGAGNVPGLDKLSAPAGEAPAAGDLSLSVSLRRGRVGVVAVLAIVVVVAVMVVFGFCGGIELTRFRAVDKDADAQARLVDDFNSYTAYVSSLFLRPIEALVTMTTQLVVMRFMPRFILRPETSRRVTALSFGMGMGLSYLLNNGFNALNVQLRPLDSQPVVAINQDPLSHRAALEESSSESIVPETTDRNPVTNTILKTLLEPRETPSNACLSADPRDTIARVALFGVSPRPWHKLVLHSELTSSRRRCSLYSENLTNSEVEDTKAQCPVDLATAAWLFESSRGVMRETLPKLVSTSSEPPLIRTNDGDFAMFARQIRHLSKTMLDPKNNARVISVDLDHVQISPAIRFDSITWTLELDSLSVDQPADFYRNATCASIVSGLCEISLPTTNTFEPNVGVYVAPVCLSGPNSKQFLNQHSNGAGVCQNISNTSIALNSISTYLTADKVESTRGSTTPETIFRVHNLRRILKISAARLSWEEMDVDSTACIDISTCPSLVLNNPQGSSLALSMNDLPWRNQRPGSFVMSPLIKVQSVTNTNREILLPHHVRDFPSNNTFAEGHCLRDSEVRLRSIFVNHLYMEDPLQATYTIGIFYLFQRARTGPPTATVGVVPMAAAADLPLLSAATEIALEVSIPRQNAWLTLMGCGALIVLLTAVIAVSSFHQHQENSMYEPMDDKEGSEGIERSDAGRRPAHVDPLANITGPAAIAQALLDSAAFPDWLVRRRFDATEFQPPLQMPSINGGNVSMSTMTSISAMFQATWRRGGGKDGDGLEVPAENDTTTRKSDGRSGDLDDREDSLMGGTLAETIVGRNRRMAMATMAHAV